jgi:microsomal epoxide hydrolase
MRPFAVDVPQADLDDLRQRLTRTRWPDAHAGGWERGVPLPYLRELVRYWCEDYDWRAAEARINAHPQYITEINGATVHFLHVRSPEPGAVPLLLSHGWPGSVVEFLNVVGPLTDPRAHGLDPDTAFHVVIPSLPGFGFSQPLTPGWEAGSIASLWAELMARLGYGRYVAQGGDVGSVISIELGRQAPEHVLGVHVNMLLTYPPDDSAALAELDGADRARLAALGRFESELSGYMKVQSTRPQTLAYALTDSPVAQLAWIVERFKDWTDCAEVPEEAVDRDAILTNVSLYWLTASGGSSAQLYFEGAKRMERAISGTASPPLTVPLGVAVFPKDIFLPVRRLADRQYGTITRWTEFERGGHFAALEQPADFVRDVRAFVDSIPGIRQSRVLPAP